MRPIWKGAVSLGLVNIPVKMYAASEDKSIKFKYLHRECGTPIKYQRVCPNCQREVDWGEIAKGYEFQQDQFVLMEEEDFQGVLGEKSRTIDILDFCRLQEIDPIYYEKSYFLGPEETGKKAYNLLVSSLSEMGRVAVAKVVLRTKESLAVLRIYKDVLVMETMKYPDEVRSQLEVPGIDPKVLAEERELGMANQLVETMTAAFVPEKYTDSYRQGLLALIEKKLEGEEPAPVRLATPGAVTDLMDSLRASLEAIEKDRFTPKEPGKAKKSDRTG